MLVVAVSTAAAPAVADGALFVGIPPGGLRSGFAYGLSYDHENVQNATNGALERCRKETQQHRLDPATQCQLIGTFKNRCAVIAMDVQNRWAGWAIADRREDAAESALANCAVGGSACKVTDANCDTR